MESQTLEQVAASALQQLVTDLASVKQFAIGQAPEICQQLLLRDTIIAWLLLGVAGLAAGVTLWLWRMAAAIGDSELRCAVRAALAVLGGAAATALAATSCETLVEICASPKVYLIEHLSRMLK